jgi:energy-coupling factor transporter ATP-binding protein EcfA2
MQQPAHALLKFESVTFGFPAGNTPIRGVDLEIHAGDLVLLSGGNGEGKSVLLKLMGGFLDATQGTVRYNGADLRELPERTLDEQVLMLRTEGGGILVGPTVEDELSRACRVAGLRGAAIPKRVEDALSNVGMESSRDWYLDEMSSGERRRIALAHALVSRPRLLLLDDPYTGLDRQGAEFLNGVLRDLSRRGTAVVFTGHDLSVLPYCERLLVVSNGEIALDVPARVAVSEPQLLWQCGVPLPTHIALGLALRERGLVQFSQAPLSLEEIVALLPQRH